MIAEEGDVHLKKILLLPFCLSDEARSAAEAMAAAEGYVVVVATSTAKALAEVRRHAVPRSGRPVRIVGVVCDGRAKKVWAGLLLLKARQWGKRLLRRKVRRIELARVAIVGGTKSLFGRRHCSVGRNEPDMEGLRRALAGQDTFMKA
ncbi:MAG: hypothetical protein HZB86_09215 [Deltaproteobacteria bacterium]|nr:hypothetical protein [Deltaproteobacteria bacterium]